MLDNVEDGIIAAIERRVDIAPWSAPRGCSSLIRSTPSAAGLTGIGPPDGPRRGRDARSGEACRGRVGQRLRRAAVAGGTLNPDQLRMNSDAVRFVKAYGKPVAAICQAPLLPTVHRRAVRAGRRPRPRMTPLGVAPENNPSGSNTHAAAVGVDMFAKGAPWLRATSRRMRSSWLMRGFPAGRDRSTWPERIGHALTVRLDHD